MKLLLFMLLGAVSKNCYVLLERLHAYVRICKVVIEKTTMNAKRNKTK